MIISFFFKEYTPLHTTKYIANVSLHFIYKYWQISIFFSFDYSVASRKFWIWGHAPPVVMKLGDCAGVCECRRPEACCGRGGPAPPLPRKILHFLAQMVHAGALWGIIYKFFLQQKLLIFCVAFDEYLVRGPPPP